MRLIILILLIASTAYAKDLGTVGNTYPVAEKDMLKEMQERAAEVDWQKIIESKRAEVKKKAGAASLKLLKAEKNRTFYLNMTYVLDHDIHTYDQKGEITGILYKKGFVYNPLDYIKVPETYVIINGTRKAEVDWFKSRYARTPLVYPLISDGNAIETAGKIGRPVYVLQENMKQLFKLEHTISVVYPEGKRMRVDEIKVADEKVINRNPAGSYKHK